MNYDEAVKWLDGFQQFGMKLGLDRIQALLAFIHNPEKNMKIIHVAGTNGKGSVCRYLSSILIEAGYKVGLYLSPHLKTIRERCIINNKMITKKDFSKYVSKIKSYLESNELKNLNPTYFEICTALAFLYFKDKNVDYIVLEVGLGGRYDATNVINPIASIITNISFDHQHILGETIEQIAMEKAGIIKEKIPVITGACEPALSIISSVAKAKNAPVYQVKDEDVKALEKDIHGQVLEITSNLNTYTLQTSELGAYQEKNLALVMKTLDVLQMNGLYIPSKAIEEGIKKMVHPGRMDLIQKDPIILIDGAHNIGGIIELKKTITDLFSDKKIILIFGILTDKKYKEMLSIMHPLVKLLIITKSTNNRAMDPHIIKEEILHQFNEKVIVVTTSIPEAIKRSLNKANKDDVIIISGSLYTVAEAISYFSNKKKVR